MRSLLTLENFQEVLDLAKSNAGVASLREAPHAPPTSLLQPPPEARWYAPDPLGSVLV